MNIKNMHQGMRVRFVGKQRLDEGPKKGQMGTITRVYYADKIVDVEFDQEINGGHDCGGTCKDGFGFHFYSKDDANGQYECYNYLKIPYSWRKL